MTVKTYVYFPPSRRDLYIIAMIQESYICPTSFPQTSFYLLNDSLILINLKTKYTLKRGANAG